MRFYFIQRKRKVFYMVLEMKGVTKVFGKRKVLDNVSLTVKEGEVLGFLGPNGAGKTTAIKIMLGLLNPTAGEVFINGYSVKKDFEKALERVGGIIESPDMYNYLTGYDNLMLCARMHGLGKERVFEVAEQVKLRARLNDKVGKYSLGMRQRLGVAQALINKPNLLVLDEPTNGLDPVGIKELRDTIRLLAKNGTSVFVSSHLLAEMELMCDTLCIIEQGVVVTQKSLTELITQESSGQKLSYRFNVDKPDTALALINENGFSAELNDENIFTSIDKNDAANIAKLLITNGISLYSMSAEQKTLEKAFLEVTHGSKDQIA